MAKCKEVDKLLQQMQKSRDAAEKKAPQVEALRTRLSESDTNLHRIVSEYNNSRIAAVNAQLAADGNSWCTCCLEIFPLKDAKLILHEYERDRRGGYDGQDTITDQYSFVYRACPACHIKCRMSTAQKSRVLDVEQTEDGLYVDRRGKKEKLSHYESHHTVHVLPRIMPAPLLAKLAMWWNIPPAIKVAKGSIVAVEAMPPQVLAAA